MSEPLDDDECVAIHLEEGWYSIDTLIEIVEYLVDGEFDDIPKEKLN